MIYRLEVWINLAGHTIPAGEMVCEIAAGGKGQGAFRYSRDYLNHTAAFALDPISLPLNDTTFSIGHPGIFGVFQDSLPDDWGKRLLIRKHALPRSRQNLPELLRLLDAAGMGALSYTPQGQPVQDSPESPILNLQRLVQEAHLFETAHTDDADITHLLSAGSSPGGARPKALVHDPQEGQHYLAKFPSSKDTVDVVRIEAATLSLAAQAGLSVPNNRLVQCGDRPVLLVERFDVLGRIRRHMASLQTLLKAEGYYQCRYRDLIDVIRKVSVDPLTDSCALFRQMVFNAVVGNTDDHLKNFWMVCDTTTGWRLSPSFDLLPDIGRCEEHILFFDMNGYYPGRQKLERLGKEWGIPKAAEITQQVYDALQGWKEEFSRQGVPEGDIRRFAEIDRHLSE